MELVLVFQVAEEFYGLEIAHIQEVVDSPTYHYIPKAPESFVGAINFHGTILPVLDLMEHLSFPRGERDHRVIVLVPSICRLALSPSTICKVVPMDSDSMTPLQEDGNRNFIRAMFTHDEKMINLLDLAALCESLNII